MGSGDQALILTPDDDTSLRVGDQLLAAGKDDGLSDLSDALFSTATIDTSPPAGLCPPPGCGGCSPSGDARPRSAPLQGNS